MAAPSDITYAGTGMQVGDGREAEVLTGVLPAPQTATATATLTVAQVLGKVLVGDPSTTAATYTLPTAALLDAAIPNRKVNTTFDLSIINLGTSTGVITVAVGTGITLVGMATLPITTAAGSSGTWRFRKTGTAAWTAYRVS
jgi:hypothetical protein